MLCNGRTDFTDINQYQDDTVFANAYEAERLPSESLLRQRLDELPPKRSHQALRCVNTELLSKQSFGTLQAGHLELVPVDIDVSPSSAVL